MLILELNNNKTIIPPPQKKSFFFWTKFLKKNKTITWDGNWKTDDVSCHHHYTPIGWGNLGWRKMGREKYERVWMGSCLVGEGRGFLWDLAYQILIPLIWGENEGMKGDLMGNLLIHPHLPKLCVVSFFFFNLHIVAFFFLVNHF